MTLPAEITAALVALALTIVGSIGTLVTLLVRYWQRRIEVLTTKLDENTQITQEVHSQTNGRFAAVTEEATKWRAAAERTMWILREVNKTPEGRALLDRVMDQHRSVVRDQDFDAMLERLMRKAPPR